MRKDITSALLAVVAFTLLLGVAYPLMITGISQVAFGNRADGSLTTDASGKVNGSRLIGRDFSRPVKGADGTPRKDAADERSPSPTRGTSRAARRPRATARAPPASPTGPRTRRPRASSTAISCAPTSRSTGGTIPA